MYLGWLPDAAFLRPYADRAIRELGYIRADRTDQFIGIVVRLWNTSPRDHYWRREVETLSPDELKMLGIDKWAKTPRILIETLSPKGLLNPEARFDASFRHVRNAVQRDNQRQRDLKLYYRSDGTRSPMWGGFQFTAAPQYPCARAVSMDGKPLEEPPALPLPGCDSEVCACYWRMLTRREAERR